MSTEQFKKIVWNEYDEDKSAFRLAQDIETRLENIQSQSDEVE